VTVLGRLSKFNVKVVCTTVVGLNVVGDKVVGLNVVGDKVVGDKVVVVVTPACVNITL
jgi:hypothetical protein